MLEKIPAGLGHALQGVRAGEEKLIWADPQVGAPETITVESAAFENEGPLPPRFTEDGDKTSPPLAWRGVPAEARSLLLVVEDADSPTPAPIVHLIAAGLPAQDGVVEAGGFDGQGGTGAPILGRNSFRKAGWLPPDPPCGHGAHRYVVQAYALDHAPVFDGAPEKSDVLKALRGHVLARGRLAARYARPD